MKDVSIFEYEKYKEFILKWIEALPNQGRGQLQRIAEHLAVHPTLISQVIRGNKDFTAEQTCKISEFLGLSEPESDLLLSLVERDRAGTATLKSYWQRRIERLREERAEVRSRIIPAKKLSRELHSEFYSSWEYSAVRLGTSIDEFRTIDSLAQRLGLKPKRCREIIDFLLSAGLCKQHRGQYEVGPLRTHVDPAQAMRHHINWRLKSLEAHSNLRQHELAFSAPISIAKKDREKAKEILLRAVEEISKLIEKSHPEELLCLNIDWFDVRAAK